MVQPTQWHLAVALDGTGAHPASWRSAQAGPGELLTAGYWLDLVERAESGLLDFVTFADSLGPQSDSPHGVDDRTDRVRGRLDAGLIAARVAPRTRHVGLVPVAVVTHTEPFHISKAIATLDYVSGGRAGWLPQVSASAAVNAHFGRRAIERHRLLDEAADHVEVVRRLWDSWEDDAEIRDVATGRFVDRDKLHYIDFRGEWFHVKGPSITPRPPQGQPLVTATATDEAGFGFAARSADVVFTPLPDPDAAERAVALAEGLHVFGDLVVHLGPDAADRKARLDALDQSTSDLPVFVGEARELADLLAARAARGITGFRLHPGELPADLDAITGELVPELQRRGVFRTGYQPGTLRDRLGLARPVSRYASAGGTP
ncbi:LLM class flavin-dependent oxidoreductase [Saccharopolyspora flava]|uniref:Flavin-dependent oxidoreductase, luciferase family (Includes alkanesulfonate monooxygenase SsuD and methylene tetrahydromethanopterin reductase) n=1 Tax=Saccharopolyspora flava TaxID=95161 RepID=A0A1I6SPD5_9PSEU|nr:LLM class flavin-dependent oxidoreductase [Saccharopolyspora flava]SFS78750.1 Flavin-dependent oxidoreductase, luciferase family (includes alkanesulfonate monooxygenase SsuD and methylene tetrahydromethanopterin reductase) [Saccharopolyspora flava]